MFIEYRINPDEARIANLDYRRSIALKTLLSYLAVKEKGFSAIPGDIQSELHFSVERYRSG